MADITQTLIPAGGGDYTLMSTAESTAQGLYGNLVGDGNTYTLECYAGTSNDYTTWSGWTCDATSFVTVKPADGEGHGGVIGAGLVVNNINGSNSAVNIEIPFMVLDGICLQHNSSGSSGLDIDWPANNVTASNLIIYTLQSNMRTGILVLQNISGIHLYNNLVRVGDGTWTGVSLSSETTVDSCTVVGTGDGGTSLGAYRVSNSSPAYIFKNCIGHIENHTTQFTTNSGGVYDPSSTNNASMDSSAPGSNPQVSITTADFEDYAGGDYTPATGGKLDGTGADLSGSFTDDITGFTRTVPWEIGAYEIQGAAPGVSFDGPNILAQTGDEDVLFSFDEGGSGTVASRFTGATSYALAPTSDPLQTGLTVNPTTGNIEGTPTEVATRNIIIEGSD